MMTSLHIALIVYLLVWLSYFCCKRAKNSIWTIPFSLIQTFLFLTTGKIFSYRNIGIISLFLAVFAWLLANSAKAGMLFLLMMAFFCRGIAFLKKAR